MGDVDFESAKEVAGRLPGARRRRPHDHHHVVAQHLVGNREMLASSRSLRRSADRDHQPDSPGQSRPHRRHRSGGVVQLCPPQFGSYGSPSRTRPAALKASCFRPGIAACPSSLKTANRFMSGAMWWCTEGRQLSAEYLRDGAGRPGARLAFAQLKERLAAEALCPGDQALPCPNFPGVLAW